MVSTYSLRPVYTFLYKIINGNVTASFVQTKKNFEILWSKKTFCVCTHSLTPLPPCTQSSAFGLTPPLPLCEYVLCGWPRDGYFYAVNEITKIQHIKPSTVKVYHHLKKLDKNLERTHFQSTLESFAKNGYFVPQEEARKNQFFQLNHLKIF